MPWRSAASSRSNWREAHCANTDPQRTCLVEALAKTGQLHPVKRDLSDVLDHATSEIAIGSKLGIDATKKIPGEGFKRPWPPLIRMSEDVRSRIEALFPGERSLPK